VVAASAVFAVVGHVDTFSAADTQTRRTVFDTRTAVARCRSANGRYARAVAHSAMGRVASEIDAAATTESCTDGARWSALARLADLVGIAGVPAASAVRCVTTGIQAIITAFLKAPVASEAATTIAHWLSVCRCGATLPAASAVREVMKGIDARSLAQELTNLALNLASPARANLAGGAGFPARAAVLGVRAEVDTFTAAAGVAGIALVHAFARNAAARTMRRILAHGPTATAIVPIRRQVNTAFTTTFEGRRAD